MTQIDTPAHESRITFYVSRFTPRLNPLIIKDMRGYVRGSRAFWTLTGYLLGLGVLAYGLYKIILVSAHGQFGPGGPPMSAFVGQSLFLGLAFLEMLAVCFVTPALTSGTISGEVERHTYDTLLSTSLRPVSILWGKMVASLIYVQLLILAAIPLFSIVFLFGGVSLRDMVQAVGLLGLTAITYGTLGLFFSALTRRTGRATVWSYLVVVGLIFGSILAWWVVSAGGNSGASPKILYLNPISALISAVVTPGSGGSVYSMGPAIEALFSLGGGYTVLGLSSIEAPARPLWQYTVALYGSATVILYLLTTQLVKPVRRWRIGWRGLMVVLAVVALLSAGLWFVFGTNRGSTGFRPEPPPTVVEPMPEVLIGVSPPPPLMPTPTPFVDAFGSPLPTPTPLPPPPTAEPFDVSGREDELQSYLEDNLAPGSDPIFCDVEVLDSSAGVDYAEVNLWVYCRAFQVVEGELTSDLLLASSAGVDFYWTPEPGWQIGGYWFSYTSDPGSPWMQRLLEDPFDEAAAQARLEERARQALLGE